MSEWPRGFHDVNQVWPCALPRRWYQMKYGTHSANMSANAMAAAVEMSIAQLLRARSSDAIGGPRRCKLATPR
jgi:hypothetical protein